MIKRLVVELTEALCDCPPGTPLALDMETCKEDGSYEFQVACTECKSYISTPLTKLRALVRVSDNLPPAVGNNTNSGNKKRPKLILLQGGAATNNEPSDESQKISS